MHRPLPLLPCFLALMLVSSLLATQRAWANHHSFCYSGPLHHCGGEAHLIAALESMEHAFQARACRIRRAAAEVAHDELRLAVQEVPGSDIRQPIYEARHHLRRFRLTDADCDLDAAAEATAEALEALHLRFPLEVHQELAASECRGDLGRGRGDLGRGREYPPAADDLRGAGRWPHHETPVIVRRVYREPAAHAPAVVVVPGGRAGSCRGPHPPVIVAPPAPPTLSVGGKNWRLRVRF